MILFTGREMSFTEKSEALSWQAADRWDGDKGHVDPLLK